MIRDRNTGEFLKTKLRLGSNAPLGVSRQFAFCRFATIPNSTAFMERNYPSIYLNSSESGSQVAYNREGEVKVRIAFSRERDDRDRPSRGEEEWKCRAVRCLTLFVAGDANNLAQCGLPNYARRVECFRCQAPRAGGYGAILGLQQTSEQSRGQYNESLYS